MWIKKFIGNANYKRFLNNLKIIAKKEKKLYFFLIIDYAICLIKYGFVFNDYLNYEIYNKKRKERKEYVSVKDQDKFYEIVSPSKYKDKFSIKSNFMKIFKDYVQRDFITKEAKDEEYLKFFKKHEEIIIKPVDGLGGANVSKIKTKNIKNHEFFIKEAREKNYLIEEVIKQHPKLAKLAPSSINTIRIMTSNICNNPKVLFATLRIGNGKSHVDNFHQGGMATLIDLETGKIISEAIDKDLNHYKKHPLTKEPFLNYQIPYFPEVKKLVLEASKVVPEIMVVGWDIAITPKGPVIVEGNRRAGFDIVQVVSNKGRKDIINTVLDEYKVNKED